MITLQNNFTTSEQSKRLLELGVPVDSADCYYFSQDSDIPLIQKGNGVPLYPCWSVGRLMEICGICSSYELAVEIYSRAILYIDITNGFVCEMAYETNKGNIDFSKLEE